MAEFLEQKDRNVLPTWRPFCQTVTAQSGDIASLPSDCRDAPTLSPQPLLDAHQDFERSRSSWYATDLLAAASVYGDADAARDAAEFILEDPGAKPLARDLASSHLGIGAVEKLQLYERDEMVRARQILRFQPRDGIAWADLCYGLVVAGKFDAAKRAMATALTLAPLSRFVLRAATRFYAHIGEFDRALEILRRHPRTPLDPWLVAAELATARSAKAHPKFVRQARDLLAGRFSPRQVTELASALGMLEYQYAVDRRHNHRGKSTAYRLIGRSLQDPNDNSLAQATWFRFREAKSEQVRVSRSDRNFEAQAWDAFARGDPEALLVSTERWFDDQPFAERPADLFAWTASSLTIGSVQRGIEVLKRATRANPQSASLWNNLAYSHALEEEYEQAERALRKCAAAKERNDNTGACLKATGGMLAFRRGRIDRGRELYREAIEEATRHKLDDRIEFYGYANLAREEALQGSERALEAMTMALELAHRGRHRSDTRPLIFTTLRQIALIEPSADRPVLSEATYVARDLLRHASGTTSPQPASVGTVEAARQFSVVGE